MNIPIFCINLESEKQRRQHIESEWIQQFGLDIQFWKATTQNDNSIKHINKQTPYLNRNFRNTEIALINSYVRLLQYLKDISINEAIIMEDDIFPNPIFKFVQNINLSSIIDEYIYKCLEECNHLNILLLHKISAVNAYQINQEYDYCYSLAKHPWGAQMNYLNKEGIDQLYQILNKYQLLIDQYQDMRQLKHHIVLAKCPFAYHYDSKAKIIHKNFTSCIRNIGNKK